MNLNTERGKHGKPTILDNACENHNIQSKCHLQPQGNCKAGRRCGHLALALGPEMIFTLISSEWGQMLGYGDEIVCPTFAPTLS